jgi:isopenicillin-N epimerase
LTFRPEYKTDIQPVIEIEQRPLSRATDEEIAAQYTVRPDTIYLNHGSFGISPDPVRAARQSWTEQVERQPMDFYVRRFEGLWHSAIGTLAAFVGTSPENLVFAENATFGMNVVADSFPLSAGDEVLTNQHEYGAVQRIWQRACGRHGARIVVARLPDAFQSTEQIVEAVFAPAGPRTRLIVVSHITSPTALIMPIREICAEARRRGIPVCIDGPHAPAHVPLAIDDMGCDFYTASCHKWLSAPLGSGFLYVHPEWHDVIQPQLKSWGRLLPNEPGQWFEEFIWSGTRDPAAYLSIPAAIGFLESVGLDRFRQRCYGMARETAQRLIELTAMEPIGADVARWYGTMAHVPLPPGEWTDLQGWLWDEHRIEVPVIHFDDRWFIRVSHHLYNTPAQIDRLIDALRVRLRTS